MTFPIVGAHFRPPAKGVLAALPIGHPIWLVAEPENPYDPNAIMAVMEKSTILELPPEVQAAMETMIVGYGFEIETLLPLIHLGYIPRTMTSQIHPKLIPEENEPSKLQVKLSYTSDGKPSIVLE